jgi:hypothetical protein
MIPPQPEMGRQSLISLLAKCTTETDTLLPFFSPTFGVIGSYELTVYTKQRGTLLQFFTHALLSNRSHELTYTPCSNLPGTTQMGRV